MGYMAMADLKQVIVEKEELDIFALVCRFALRDLVMSEVELSYLKSLYLKVIGKGLTLDTPENT